jgi:hypothetical protein
MPPRPSATGQVCGPAVSSPRVREPEPARTRNVLKGDGDINFESSRPITMPFANGINSARRLRFLHRMFYFAQLGN